MPFRSKAQRRLLRWKHPRIYRKWKRRYGAKIRRKKR